MHSSNTLPSILMIGCGHMGKAMLKSWLDHHLPPSVIVNRSTFSLPSPHRLVSSIDDIPADCNPDVIVLAVKPHQAKEVTPALKKWANKALFISVLAGKTLEGLGEQLGKDAAIMRVMPNTPVEIGKGMISAIANQHVTSQQRKIGESLLHTMGQVAWLDAEEQMDAAAAIAGSGPAYIFLLAELLQNAAEEQGLSHDLAKQLARQTVIGSAALLANTSKESSQLRQEIATPNGMTERALNVLMEKKAWPDAMSKAITAATKRSKEMAS